MTDMFIPNLFKLPPPRKVDPGQQVTSTMRKANLDGMVRALESVGYVVRHHRGEISCMVDGLELLRAIKGKRGTYLVRYRMGIVKLQRGSK